MSTRACLCAALAGGLLAATTGAGAAPARAAAPGAANARAAVVQERRALRALPAGAGAGSCARSLPHVRAALTDLRSVLGALAAAARASGPLANDGEIERLLNLALASGSHASAYLDQAIWLANRGATSAGAGYVTEARTDLRRSLAAATRLARILSA